MLCGILLLEIRDLRNCLFRQEAKQSCVTATSNKTDSEPGKWLPTLIRRKTGISS